MGQGFRRAPRGEGTARSAGREGTVRPRDARAVRRAWFLAGDFRGESDDSRFWGPVPTKAITGVVKYRYWPLKHAGRL